jgi:transposase InsO family protein
MSSLQPIEAHLNNDPRRESAVSGQNVELTRDIGDARSRTSNLMPGFGRMAPRDLFGDPGVLRFATVDEVTAGLRIDRYNNRRPHSSLGYLTSAAWRERDEMRITCPIWGATMS